MTDPTEKTYGQRVTLVEIVDLAYAVCTRLELDAVAAYLEHGSLERAAERSGCSYEALRSRYRSAVRKIRAARSRT